MTRVRIPSITALATALTLLLLGMLAPSAAMAAPPSNDGFANPLALSAATSPLSGSTVEATREPDEPVHWNTGEHSVWFSYTAPRSRAVEITTCGSQFDTVLAVYTGASLANLAVVGKNDDSRCGLQSVVQFNATAGTTYRVALDGYSSSSSGVYALTLDESVPILGDRSSAPISLTPNTETTADNTGATAEPGEQIADVPAAHSLWYSVSVPSGAPVVVDTCGSSIDTLLEVSEGGYGGSQTLASNDDAAACGAGGGSLVRVTSTTGRLLIAVDGKAGATGTIRLTTLTNDTVSGAQTLSGGGELVQGSTARANIDAPETAPGVWYVVYPTAGARITADTCANAIGALDTEVVLYTGGYGGLTEIVRNDDTAGCAGGTGSAISYAATSSTPVFIEVHGKAAARGGFTLRVATTPANDARANATALSSSANFSVTSTNFGATAEPGEPAHDGSPAVSSVWFSWPVSAGTRSLNVCGAFTPRIAVYAANLTPVVSARGQDGSTCATVSLSVAAPTTYLVAVDTATTSIGGFTLTGGTGLANDAFADASSLSGSFSASNAAATAEQGEPRHAGADALRSVWYRIDPSVYDAARMGVEVCGASTWTPRLAVYTGGTLATLSGVVASSTVANGCVRVSWTRPTGTAPTYWIAVDAAGAGGTFGIRRTYPPANDARSDARTIGGTNALAEFGSVYDATREPGEPDHAGAGGSASAWYAWTPTTTTRMQLDLCGTNGSAWNSALAVYTDGYGGLSEVTSADDTPGCGDGTQPRVVFTAQAGTRYLIAIDGHGSARGGYVLRGRAAPTTFGDERANPIPLLLLQGQSSFTAWLDLATKEPGEPNHAGQAGGHSIWFNWTSPTGGVISFDTCDELSLGYLQVPDTLLAVYTQGYGGLSEVTSNDDTAGCGPNGRGSRVSFTAAPQTPYLIAVDGKTGAVGDFRLSWSPPNDGFASPSTLYSGGDSRSTMLSRATAEPGEPSHAGQPASNSVWYAWTPERTALATVDTCTSSTVYGRAAVYTGATLSGLTAVLATAGSSCPSGQSGTRTRFNATAGTTYRIALDRLSALPSSANVFMSARLAPSEDRLDAPAPLGTSSSASWYSSTRDAGREAGEPDHAGAGGSASLWFRWTAPRSTTAQVDTCSSSTNFDTALAVYTQSSTGFAGLRQIGAADDTTGCGGGTRSRVRFHADAGTTYLIAVDGHAGATGDLGLQLATGPTNDDLELAEWLSSGASFLAGTQLAGHQTGEPAHDGAAGDRSVWWRFTLDADRNAAVRLCPTDGSVIAAALYRLTGAVSLANLAPAGTSTTTADGCRVFWVRRGQGTYYVALDGRAPGAEPFARVSLAVAPSNDDQDRPSVVSGFGDQVGTTFGATREAGEPAHAGVVGAGSVWYSWTATRSGEQRIEVCDPGFESALAVYTASGGALTEVTSSATQAPGCTAGSSRVAFQATAGTTYLIAVDTEQGTPGSFTLGFPPANDRFVDALGLGAFGSTQYGTTVRAVAESGEPAHAGTAAARSVWYSWAPARSGSATISTCAGADEPTRLAIYRGTQLASLTPVAASGPVVGCAGGQGARIRTRLSAGETYLVAVDSTAGGRFTLSAALAPINDDRSNAQVISAPGEFSGSTDFASSEAGEAAHAGAAADQSVWFRLIPTNSGTVDVKTCDASFDTRLAVYRADGTPVTSASSWAGVCANGSDRAAVSFAATSGTTYYLALDGEAGASGAYLLSVGAPANDDLSRAVPLTGAHISATGDLTAATTQSAEPRDTYPYGLRSIWWTWTAPTTGAVELNACGSSTTPTLDVFTGTTAALTRAAINTGATGCGGRARLTIGAQAGTTYWIRLSGSAGAVRLQIAPPDNDLFAAAQPITGRLADVSGSLLGAARQDGEPADVPNGAGRTLWYAWTAPEDGRLTVDTCTAATASGVAVYRGTTLAGLTPIAPAGDQQSCPSAGDTRTVPVQSGQAYRIVVDGTTAAAGAITLRLRFSGDSTPPVTTISSAPPARTNAATVQVQFTANEPSTFRCRLDAGTPQACTSPWSVSPAEGAHTIYVQATDAAGNVEASGATATFTVDRTPPTLTVDPVPSPSRGSGLELVFRSPESGAAFSCSVDGAPATACTSPFALEVPNDGSHTASVTAADDLGNTSDARTVTFVVDRTPPITTVTSSPAATVNDADGRVEFTTSEPVDRTGCSYDGAPFAPCASPLTLRAMTDGEHVLQLRSVDLVGNEEFEVVERRWTVDRTAPSITVSAAPIQPTRAAPAFTLSSDDPAARFICTLDNEQPAACSSPHTPDASTSGAHVLRVVAEDAAGNRSANPVERRFTIDRTAPVPQITAGPNGTVGFDAVTFTFTSDDPSATYRCSLEGQTPATCASPVTYRGVPEGPHTFRLVAIDALGNESAPLERPFVVDATRPTTTIDRRPQDPTNAAAPVIEFRSEPGATFTCALDGAAPTPCTSPLTLVGLAEGDHTVRIRARDAAGNDEATAAEVLFEIDRTPPETAITQAPTGPVHRSAAFAYTGTEDGGFECRFDDEDWVNCTPTVGGIYSAPLTGRPAGAHRFQVRSIDAAGNADPSPAERTITIENARPTATLELTPESGPAELEVVAGLGASDGDDDDLTYRLDFGDGTVERGDYPVEGGIPHVYERAGVYVVSLTIDDGYDEITVTRSVHVVLAEPLRAAAGDDIVAVAGEPVTLDGSASRPLAGVEGFAWTLGDGASADGETVTHTYAEPGTYTARLTIRAGAETSTDTVTVRVVAPTADFVDALVTSAGSPLAAADVVVVLPDGRRISAVTGADGHARLRGLPDGSVRVLAYKPGYLPDGAPAQVSGGSGSTAIELRPGEVAKAEVDSRRLSREEILDLGIDPNDPANQHVFQFTVNVAIKDPVTGGASSASFGGFGGAAGGGFVPGAPTRGGLTCRRLVCKGTTSAGAVFISYSEPEPGVPTLTTLVIPFRAKWLKEFFEVGLTVSNLAAPEFVLEHGAASISLPNGVSLAPTARGERLTQPMGDIAGGQEKRVTWIIRGDDEGLYKLAADYAGTLAPFGRGVSLHAEMDDPLHVWGGSALKLIVDLDRTVRDRYPMTVRVGLKNVSDAPVYNPSVELLKDGRHGYIEQPRQQREFATQEIAPEATFWAGPFILVPGATGEVDLANSFVKKTAGDVNLASEIITHERQPAFEDVPEIGGHRRPGNKIVLIWEPAPGTTGDDVHTTPDRETDFADEPVAVRTFAAGGRRKVMFTDERLPWVAVSSTLQGRKTLVHPIVNAATMPVLDLSVNVQATTACRATSASLDMSDPDFAITKWEYAIDDGPWTTGAGTGPTAEVPLPSGNSTVRYRVRVTNAEGEVRESSGKRSVCTSEWPKAVINADEMTCSGSDAGTGKVVLSAIVDPETRAPITELSYIVGSRPVETKTFAAGQEAKVELNYGPADSYRLRTGGEVIRLAARDANGSVGEVAIRGICPEFIADDAVKPNTEQAPQTESEQGNENPHPAPKQSAPSGCKTPSGELEEDNSGYQAAFNTGKFPVRLGYECIFRLKSDKHTWLIVDARVRLGGIDFVPLRQSQTAGAGKSPVPGISSAIMIRTASEGAPAAFGTVGPYELKIGSQHIARVDNFKVSGPKFKAVVNEVAESQFKGLSVPDRGATLQIDFEKDQATISLGFAAEQLGKNFSNVDLDLSASATYTGGLQLASIKLHAQGQIGPALNVKGDLFYRRRDGKDQFAGDVSAAFSGAAQKFAGLSANLSFSIVDGKLERAGGAVTKYLVPPLQLGTTPVSITKIGLDLAYDNQGANRSLSLGGRIGVQVAGFQISPTEKLALLDGEMGLLFSLNENSSDALRLEGSAKLLSGKWRGDEVYGGTYSGESTIRFSGFVDLQGAAVLQPSFLKDTFLEDQLKAEGKVFAWLDLTGDAPRASLFIDGKLAYLGREIDGKASLTTRGVAVCGTGKLFGKNVGSLGGTLEWGQTPNLDFGCDFEKFAADENPVKVSPSAAELFGMGRRAVRLQATGPMRTQIKAGSPPVAYLFKGRDTMPTITVSGPGGLAFDTANPPSDPRIMVLRNPVSDQVMVIFAVPAAGDYTFTPSAPVDTVARSIASPAPKVRATVRRLPDGRAKLSYAIRDRQGRAVRIMERSASGAIVVGTARRDRGSLTYRPEPGKRGKRDLYAISGESADLVRIGSYRYAGPPPAGRPGRITTRLRADGLTIRVGRASGDLLGYRFRIKLRGGRTITRFVERTARKLTVSGVPSGTKVQIRIVALNKVGKAGPAREASVVAGKRR